MADTVTQLIHVGCGGGMADTVTQLIHVGCGGGMADTILADIPFLKTQGIGTYRVEGSLIS